MKTFLPACLAIVFLTACACPGPASTETPATGGGTTDPGLDPGTTPPPETPVSSPPPDTSGRTPSIPSNHPLLARVEGISFQNACQQDSQCFVGGCSSEICTAEQGVSGTCEAPADGWPTTGSACGCVQGQCVWYGAASGSGAGSGSGSGSSPVAPGQGEKCGANDACASGLSCLTYYGIAGPRGPEFKSCEIPCAAKGSTCPAGQKCITIADGPGQVCRP